MQCYFVSVLKYNTIALVESEGCLAHIHTINVFFQQIVSSTLSFLVKEDLEAKKNSHGFLNIICWRSDDMHLTK